MVTIPSTIIELFDDAVALHVGTRDAALRPESVSAWAPSLDGGKVTIHVPVCQARRTIDNLADNQRIAVTICRLADYRTYQLKRRATGWRAARPDERQRVLRHVESMALGADHEGLGDTIRRWRVWPTVAIELDVDEVFNQTPQAGTRRRAET